MTKYLIRYRSENGVFYIPVYEVSAQDAVNRFRQAYDDISAGREIVIEAVFVETVVWK